MWEKDMARLRRVDLVASGLLAVLALPGCQYSVTASCPFHCWESFLERSALPENSNELLEGYYPDQCETPASASIYPPLPDVGYAAKYCFKGDPQGLFTRAKQNSIANFNLKLAIDKSQNAQPLTHEEEEDYELWISGIDFEAYASCVAHLTCNGNPSHPDCDIDENMSGKQSCRLNSAKALCQANVVGLLEGQLELPNPQKYPECSPITYFQFNEAECQGHTPETNATGDGCLDDDGVVPGESDGADSTGAPADPFGDVAQLIDCVGNDCTVQAELLLSLTENFGVVYDEEVELELVDGSTMCGPGAKVAGLDSGEATKDLADAFSVQNGDIITDVNGISLSSVSKAAVVLDEIAASTQFTVTVKRRAGSACSSTTWGLTVEP